MPEKLKMLFAGLIEPFNPVSSVIAELRSQRARQLNRQRLMLHSLRAQADILEHLSVVPPTVRVQNHLIAAFNRCYHDLPEAEQEKIIEQIARNVAADARKSLRSGENGHSLGYSAAT